MLYWITNIKIIHCHQLKSHTYLICHPRKTWTYVWFVFGNQLHVFQESDIVHFDNMRFLSKMKSKIEMIGPYFTYLAAYFKLFFFLLRKLFSFHSTYLNCKFFVLFGTAELFKRNWYKFLHKTLGGKLLKYKNYI